METRGSWIGCWFCNLCKTLYDDVNCPGVACYGFEMPDGNPCLMCSLYDADMFDETNDPRRETVASSQHPLGDDPDNDLIDERTPEPAPYFWETGHAAIIKKCGDKGHYTPSDTIRGSDERCAELVKHGYLAANRTNKGAKRVGAYGLTDTGRAALSWPSVMDLRAAAAETVKQSAERLKKTRTKRYGIGIDVWNHAVEIARVYGNDLASATKTERGRIKTSAQELFNAGYKIEDITVIYAYVDKTYETHSPMALCSNASDALKKSKAKRKTAGGFEVPSSIEREI
ncbi:hypothetical protein LCGC14_1676040 [marine sediment metagenome]|uniref:Uncharacterized protein n=1 Tax=marine sediment metagenome TaxID=412755 RepID=A0A0F9ICD7_9ZZZZ